MNVKVVSESEFTKAFTYKENVELFFSKAYDEDSDKHFILLSIPVIEEVEAGQINYPFGFDSEAQRDEFFKNFELGWVEQLIQDIIQYIKEQKQKTNEKDNDLQSM